MKIVQVISDISTEASGPSYSVPRLSQSLAERGHEVVLSCLAAREYIPGVELDIHGSWPIAKGFGISPSHAREMRKKGKTFDIIHSHGIWCLANITPGWVVPKNGARLVASPRGSMAPWAMNFKRWKKAPVWPFQRRLYERAHLLHATASEEYEDMRNLGFRAPIAVIPNGIDVPDLPIFKNKTNFRLLFLSRIHQKKGVEILLDAWGFIQDKFENWELTIAGPGEEFYVNNLIQISKSKKLKRVNFIGPVFGEEKSNLYFDSDLFILPTYNENFGMVVAEALSHGLPVVVSEGAPWRKIEDKNCGLWVPVNSEAVKSALSKMMMMSHDERLKMGFQGREWMIEDFGWNMVGGRMESAYNYTISGGDKPDFVWL